MPFDVKITWPEQDRTLKLMLTNETLQVHGQHGKSLIFNDNNNEKWIFKIFPRIIEDEEIDILSIDLEEEPEKVKHYLHFWRVLNEYVASQIAQTLNLNVPEAIIVCSSKINAHPLSSDYQLKLGEDVIVLDEEEGRPENGEEFYRYSERDHYTIETSKKFEEILASYSLSGNATDVLGVLIKFIPNSENLDQYLENNEFETAIANIKSVDDGYKLVPLDTWLNDPDRNQGNYLVQKNDEGKLIAVWGLDYEMWSFGSDIWMDEDNITRGRSYLTAIIHSDTNLFDPRILETLFWISSLNDYELEELTLAPQIVCKFIEYNIENGALKPEERFKLLNIEENMWDFLAETRPRVETLTLRIIRQIGLPNHLSELQKKLEEYQEEIDDFWEEDEELYDENAEEET